MNFLPFGTVYGTLLNFRREVDAWQDRAQQPPYKAAPQAPVLYVKTANTWTTHGQPIAVPASVPQVEIGATAGLVMGAANTVAQVVLMNHGLKNLPTALGLGKHTYLTIKQNLFWAFAYNVVAIPVAAFGFLTPTFGALVKIGRAHV